MYKKILWVIVSCLMVLSLCIMSCDTEKSEGTVKEEGSTQVISTENEKIETCMTDLARMLRLTLVIKFIKQIQ